MFSASKKLLDNEISRRSFISGLVRGGVSLLGATAMANALATKPTREGPAPGAPSDGKVLKDLTGGEIMAEFLLEWDVPYVFGLAGSEEVGFLDALVDRTDLQYATCLHEHVAMAMADGYSRSTGKTSIVCLHSVAGAAYALGQMVSSYRDRIPVVVTAGRQAAGYRGQNGFLEAANLHELPRDYSQWIWDVMSPESIPEVLRRAFLLAEAPPGGPTFVTFSKDLWEMKVPEATVVPRARSTVAYDVAPPEHHVLEVSDILLDAQLPVLFVGNEAIRNEVSAEVAGIAEAIGALVMTANKCPIVFPTTHPNFAGQFMDDPAVTQDIDAFWALGAHMFRRAAKPKAPYLSPGTRIMHTSLASADVGRNYPVDAAAIAGIQPTAAAVLEELQRRDLSGSAIRERKRWVNEYTQKRRLNLDNAAKKQWDDQPISIVRLVSELDRHMESDAHIVSEIVTADSFPRKYLTFDHRQPVSKRRRNFDTTGGILGWGLPAAVGVKIGNPDKEVWCLSGDGCFNFGVQALWSAARYEVPIGFVVFNNGQYQANRLNMNRYQGRMVETGKYIGVQLGHPDIKHVSLAGAYGIEGERVEDPGKLAAALKRCKRAMQDGRPYLLDVLIERRFEGKDSDWYDFFSVAKNQPRAT